MIAQARTSLVSLEGTSWLWFDGPDATAMAAVYDVCLNRRRGQPKVTQFMHFSVSSTGLIFERTWLNETEGPRMNRFFI